MYKNINEIYNSHKKNNKNRGSMMTLAINFEEHHNYILLEVIGRISNSNVDILNNALDSAIDHYGGHILVDISQLYEINSFGLQTILRKRRKMNCFFMMIFCGPSLKIKSLMELVGITEFIPVVSNVFNAEAILEELDFAQGHMRPSSNSNLRVR